MIITTPSDAGDRNRGVKPTLKNQGAITFMQNQDVVLNYPLALQPPTRPPSIITSGASGHAAGAEGGNCSGGGGEIINPLPVGCLAKFYTGQLPEITVTVATTIVKSNTLAK